MVAEERWIGDEHHDHQYQTEAEAEDGEIPELLQLYIWLLECEHAALAAEVVGFTASFYFEGSMVLVNIHATNWITSHV